MAWLQGWQYRETVTIGQVAGAGTGYCVPIRIGESASAPSPDVVLGYTADAFPSGWDQSGDIRVAASDGTTLLPIWVEDVEGVGSDRTAIVWVQLSDDLSAADVIVYVYYGGPTANVSSGSQTFPFYDDFSSYTLGAIDGQGPWIAGRGTPDVAQYNGRNHLHLVSPDNGVDAHAPFSAAVADGWELRSRVVATDWNEGYILAFGDGTLISAGNIANGYETTWWGWSGGTSKIHRWVAGAWTDIASVGDSAVNDQYYTVALRWYGDGQLRGVRDGTSLLAGADTHFSALTHIHIQGWTGAERYVDWVLVRPEVGADPTITHSLTEHLSGRIAGTVTEGGAAVARTVRLYRRSTGDLVGSTTSSATDGSFEFADIAVDTYYVVALDDDVGDTYNALIYDQVQAVEQAY